MIKASGYITCDWFKYKSIQFPCPDWKFSFLHTFSAKSKNRLHRMLVNPPSMENPGSAPELIVASSGGWLMVWPTLAVGLIDNTMSLGLTCMICVSVCVQLRVGPTSCFGSLENQGGGIGARFNSCHFGLTHIMVYFPWTSIANFHMNTIFTTSKHQISPKFTWIITHMS